MEKFQIIINRPNIKDKLFILWDLKEVSVIFIFSVVSFFISKSLIGEVEAMFITVFVAILIGGIFVDLPNGLNVLDHIKLFINHFKKTLEFYYIPNLKGEEIYVCEKETCNE